MKTRLFYILFFVSFVHGWAQRPAKADFLGIVPKVNVYREGIFLFKINMPLRYTPYFGEVELFTTKLKRWSVDIPLYFLHLKGNNLNRHTGVHVGVVPKFYCFDFMPVKKAGQGFKAGIGVMWYKWWYYNQDLPLGFAKSSSLYITPQVSYQFLFWKRLAIEPELELYYHVAGHFNGVAQPSFTYRALLFQFSIGYLFKI
jgi:hypothetical protein